MRLVGFKVEADAVDIQALEGSYVPGAWYLETDTQIVRYAIGETELSKPLQWGSDASDTVQNNLDSYIDSNDTALAAEILARQNGDAALQTAVDAKAATTYVNTQLALKVNQSAYDTKIAALESADSAMQTDISENTSGLANEITRATTAEQSNATAITDEVNRATDAEGVLESAINVEKGRIDAILSGANADADTFAEVIALVNSIDTTNDQAFAGYVLSNDAALAGEIEARETADADLLSQIQAKAADSAVVHITGTETVTGEKTFSATTTFGADIRFSRVGETTQLDAGELHFKTGSTIVSSISRSGVTAPNGNFDEYVSVKDVTSGDVYYLQVQNGNLYLNTTKL